MMRIIGCASPIGRLQIGLEQQAVVWLRLPHGRPLLEEQKPATGLERAVIAQLEAYFADHRAGFDLPMAEAGTPFQQRVWSRLRQIPSGSSLTYGAVARELESGPRAVGNACRANPRPILVPCHRVLTTGGGLGGFAGRTEGLLPAIKRWLLHHEGVL